MNVAILIVSYRTFADLELCLSSLERSTHTSFRVFICENGGFEAWTLLSAHVPAKLAGGQSVDVIDQYENLGFAGGVNACLTQAGPADAYWILNPDTRPSAIALAEMIERLRRGGCTMVGHDLVLPGGQLASRGGGRWIRWCALASSIDHGKSREPKPHTDDIEGRMNYVVGASMLVSAGFIERVGLMREDYFLYCEEVEWCIRGKSIGERLGYSEHAVVIHSHGTSTGGGGPIRQRSKLSIYLQERNRLLLTRDLFPHLFPFACVAALCHLTLRYSKAAAWRQLSYALQGWAKGVVNERGVPAWIHTHGVSAAASRRTMESTQ